MDNLFWFLDNIRQFLSKKKIAWEEKKMFGGICFMIDNKMCFGTTKGQFLVRVSPDEFDSLLENSNAEPMKHGSKIMKGYLFIDPQDCCTNDRLEFWIEKCLKYNSKIASSKK